MLSSAILAAFGTAFVSAESVSPFAGVSFDGALEILKSRAPVKRQKLSVLSGVVEELQRESNLPLAMISQAVDDGKKT